MASKITVESEKGYILVQPQEGNLWAIIESFERELREPQYPDENAIWAFPDVPLDLAYWDLYQIAEMVSKNYPRDAKPDRKVAIVVQTGLAKVLAKEYIKIVEDLPIKFRVFSDLNSAKEWIC